MLLQRPDKTYRIVSYHHELHKVFSKAQESTSPKSSPLSKGIQINLTTKKKDIEINNVTKIEVTENVSFPYVTSLNSICKSFRQKKNGSVTKKVWFYCNQ